VLSAEPLLANTAADATHGGELRADKPAYRSRPSSSENRGIKLGHGVDVVFCVPDRRGNAALAAAPQRPRPDQPHQRAANYLKRSAQVPRHDLATPKRLCSICDGKSARAAVSLPPVSAGAWTTITDFL
jgi:hypothetical protein